MAQLGTLEYLITINSSKVASGLSSAEGKVKGFGNKLSSWAVAKGQIIANLASKAVSSTIDFVTGAIDERKGFDKAMSQVAATLGKSVAEMNSEIGSTDTAFGHFEGTLTDFARYMGANTAYTATEAAEALNYMALAGYDTQKSMNMLPNVLNLAAAGNFDLARASDMVTDAQSALGLTTGETTVLVDQMAKTASKTNTSVEQLGDAMLTVGGTAKMLKGGTRELNMVLGVLADNGIKGSEGGTALRNIMLSLTAPTKKASKELKKLGIDVFDSAGNMRSLPEIMGDFNEATKDMTDQQRSNILSKIFNKRDLKSIEALLGTTTERWNELDEAITDSEGAAGEMAETQLDNLAGDTTKFESALSEAKLALVEGLTPALRNLTQRGTALVQRLTAAFKKDGFKGVIDEAKNAVKDLMKEWENSESPIKRAIGRIGTILANGLSWDNLGEIITIAWDTVLAGFDKLGKLVFGEKADGTVDWPTWDDVKEAAEKAWNGIKEGAAAIADTLGGLVFGRAEDGTVAWPDITQLVKDFGTWWSETALPALQDGMKWTLTLFGVPENTAEDITNLVSGWWDTWVGTAQKALDWALNLPDTPHEAGEKLREIIDGWWKGIKSYAEGVLKWTLGLFGIGDKDGTITKKSISDWWNQKVVPLLKDALDFTLGLFKLPSIDSMVTAVNTWWGSVKDKVNEVTLSITTTVSEWITTIKSWLDGTGLTQIALDFGATVADWISTIKSWLDGTGVTEFTIQIGATVSGWIQTIADWIQNGINITANFLGLGGGGSEPDTWTEGEGGTFTNETGSGGGASNRFAKGLNTVPYDDYLARLHRGEMVLTSSQARRYRDGNGGDIAGLADLVPMIADAVRSGMQGTSVNSYLDGNNVTSRTNRITGNIISARRFAP